MSRHGIGEFIGQGYHVRPCRDMAIVCKTMSRHGNGKFQKDTA
ncbi:Regulatory nocR [Gossypium arboreum]|uniref:Regulatory nocR n=1 Tax=Gossypium arboreum TaxID=29729 RepID=A0A0B0ME75_GOSAR|nr:Regulatory nocR [Gossypium arboreum]